MVLSSKQRRAISKKAKERMNESATAKFTADIEAKVDDDADKYITLISVLDTPPPSDLDDIEEDESIDVEKSVKSSKPVEPVNNDSEENTDDKPDTGTATAENKGIKTLPTKK